MLVRPEQESLNVCDRQNDDSDVLHHYALGDRYDYDFHPDAYYDDAENEVYCSYDDSVDCCDVHYDEQQDADDYDENSVLYVRNAHAEPVCNSTTSDCNHKNDSSEYRLCKQ